MNSSANAPSSSMGANKLIAVGEVSMAKVACAEELYVTELAVGRSGRAQETQVV